MNAHEVAIASVLERCYAKIKPHDSEAIPRLEVSTAAAVNSSGERLVYFIAARSTKLAIGRKREATIGGIARSLEEAEVLFEEGLRKTLERVRDVESRRRGSAR